MILVEDSAIDDVAEVLLVTLGEEQHGLGIALRCIQQTLTVRVLAEAFEHRPHSTRELLQVLCLLFLGCLLPAPCAFAGPTKAIEVDCGVLCVGTVGTTGGQGCLRLIVVFYVDFTAPEGESVMHAAAVRVCA